MTKHVDTTSSEQSLLKTANQLYSRGEYTKALNIYHCLVTIPNLQNQAISQIFQIELNSHNYKKARKYLKEWNTVDKNSSDYLNKLANLEASEWNLYSSMAIYEKLLNRSETDQLQSILEIAKIQKKLGENKSAICLFESLLNHPKYFSSAFKELCGMDLQAKNYQQLKERIRKANEKALNKRLKSYIWFLEYLISLEENKTIDKSTLTYSQKRLIETDNGNLYQHLRENHLRDNSKNTSYFFKYINIPYLVDNVTSKLKMINPYFTENNYEYYVKMEEFIGIQEEECTKDICVCKKAGYSPIITMYPCLLSEEFDREGNQKRKKN